MLLFHHELEDYRPIPPKIYVLESKATGDIFYVGSTTLSLRKRLRCHWCEAHNWYSSAYNSPKNKRIRQEKGGIRMRMLFYACPHAEWYEMACIEVLSETYQLTNVRREIHKYGLYGGLHEYYEMVRETRAKLRAK